MPYVSSQAVKQVTTQTVNGEVTINLNLMVTLKVDQDGSISAEVKPKLVALNQEEYVFLVLLFV